jgi:site-specific DNA recombinase
MIMIAAIYARKSTEQSGVIDEARSVTRQIDHAKAYAAKNGWTVAEEHIYSDDGISGAEFDKRPGLMRLLATLKSRPAFHILVISELSRLGRETFEVPNLLKQLSMAGVSIHCYLDRKAVSLDTPMDKLMIQVNGFSDEHHRVKTAERVHDKMQDKAKSGHVTGGRCFGYTNVDVMAATTDVHGRAIRSHVELKINDTEAAVVRQIFRLYAHGKGFASIAKTLNAEGASCPHPRPVLGRPTGWAPSSVREILLRRLYRGELVWNTTKKRDNWGQKKPRPRPEREWVITPAPHLRIVSDRDWQEAHDRLTTTRQTYLRGTRGKLWGRPPNGIESKYLLSGLAQCSECGGSLYVRSRSHGKHRALFYGCTSYHLRGEDVCTNYMELALSEVDRAVLPTIEADLLQPDILEAAIQEAIALIRPS